MKNILDKIFGLKALHFLMLMFVVLALGLIYTPVESTLFGGIVLFLVMAGILFWSYKEYRKRNG